MTEPNYARVLYTLVSLTGLYVLLFWLYRDLCVDAFRQKMFELRDSLFDEAEAGMIPFDHPAYGVLRSTMNGFIRFAHRLSLLQLIIASLVALRGEDPQPSFAERWEKAADNLRVEQRERMDFYLLRMNYLAVSYVVLGSPILLVTVVTPLFFVFLGKRLFKQTLSGMRGLFEEVDSTAFAYGEPVDGAAAN